MPVHDWTRVKSGTFHHFHQTWIANIATVLNTGLLPAGYFALAEQRVRGPEPDVLTLRLPTSGKSSPAAPITALVTSPPKTRFQVESDATSYARRADRLTIRHEEGEVVAVIEIVSPGNKDSTHAMKSFTRKAVDFLHGGVHLLIIDLFSPNKRNPEGIHKAIWDRIRDEAFELPPDKPLTLASYAAGTTITAYVEPIAVGDALPNMPLFLTPNHHIMCPLEATYSATWSAFPKAIAHLLEAL